VTTETVEPQPDETAGVPEPKRFVASWWLAAAALFFAALFGWSELRYRSAREQILEFQANQRALMESTRLIEEHGAVASQLDLLSSATSLIPLTAHPAAPGASARIILDAKERRALAVFSKLPLNGLGQEYQLWIVPSTKSPDKSAGVLEVSENGSALLTLRDLPAAADITGFLVTREPHGGKSAPSGPVVLTGNMP
jgi:Anti-sigma-K factor rskA